MRRTALLVGCALVVSWMVLSNQLRDADALVGELAERMARLEALATRHQRLDLASVTLPTPPEKLYAMRAVRERPTPTPASFSEQLAVEWAHRGAWVALLDSSATVEVFVRSLVPDWDQAGRRERVIALRHWMSGVATHGPPERVAAYEARVKSLAVRDVLKDLLQGHAAVYAGGNVAIFVRLLRLVKLDPVFTVSVGTAPGWSSVYAVVRINDTHWSLQDSVHDFHYELDYWALLHQLRRGNDTDVVPRYIASTARQVARLSMAADGSSRVMAATETMLHMDAINERELEQRGLPVREAFVHMLCRHIEGDPETRVRFQQAAGFRC